MNFPRLMPPTLITRDKAAIEGITSLCFEHGEAVMKPLIGHGGAAVFKIAYSGGSKTLARFMTSSR